MTAPLPKLRMAPTAHAIKCGKPQCDECRFGHLCVRSDVCTSTAQSECHRDCGDCGGGTYLQFQGTRSAPAVCCKSPLAEIYADAVLQNQYAFKKRPRIKLKSKAIVMHCGRLSDSDTDLILPDTELVGVNVRHVWGPRGWYSRDMRDFLSIPQGCKLMLLTCTHDALLERAWESEFHHEDFASLGFDFWEVYEFSRYGAYSNFYNLWMGLRALQAGEASGSWFMQSMPFPVAKDRGPKPYAPWTQWSEAVPQMTVNWQYIGVTALDSYRSGVADLRRCLRILPAIKSLWFQGVVDPKHIFNLQRAFPGYDIYYISSAPWMRALRRSELTLTGGNAASGRTRAQLLLHNQRTFRRLVSEAVAQANSRGFSDGLRSGEEKDEGRKRARPKRSGAPKKAEAAATKAQG